MSRAKRRFGLLVSLTIATTAMMSASALAAVHPDQPYGDTKSSNWIGVGVGEIEQTGVKPCINNPDCSFDTGTVPWGWKYNGPWTECAGGLVGSVDYWGKVNVSNPTISSNCPVKFYGQPWSGRICKHVPTGTYWLRQDLRISQLTSNYAATFGRIAGGAVSVGAEVPTISPHAVRFGDPLFEESTRVAYYQSGWGYLTQAYHYAQFPLWSKGSMAMGGDPEEECGWPDLV